MLVRRIGPVSQKVVRHLVAAAVLGVVVTLWQDILFVHRDAPVWLPLIFLVCGTVYVLRVPIRIWMWWGAGASTLLWSVAPGNTVVGSIWEIGYVAAFAASFWLRGYLIASVLLLGVGIERTLVLGAFGLTQYISGSIHYVAGAQALAVIPVAFAGVVRTRKSWSRAAFAVSLLASTFLALSSGSRAVYLPLTIIMLTLTVRLSIELKRPTLVLGTVVGLAVIVGCVNVLLPWRPISAAFGQGVTLEVQTYSVSEYGGVTQRLRLWDQTLDIARAHPFGSGTGSYQSVIHTYQKYPMVWSASPHNYYVETAATGGWLRAVLLLAILVAPTWRAWRSGRWPWALATFGIWTTLAFDVTSYYPIFMMYAFATLGATSVVSQVGDDLSTRRNAIVSARASIAVACLLVGVGLTAWWYVPCSGTTCATSRYLGVDFKAITAVSEATPKLRAELLARLRLLYPESLWVLRVEQEYVESALAELSLAREIAQRFPYQHPENYLAWANAALAVGDVDEARRAAMSGLGVFPEEQYPYGERRMTPERYQAWLDSANAIVELER